MSFHGLSANRNVSFVAMVKSTEMKIFLTVVRC